MTTLKLDVIEDRIHEYSERFAVEVRSRELQQLQKGLVLLESVGDWIDPTWEFRNDPEMRGSTYTDKRDGGNQPDYRTEQELMMIRANARVIANANAYAVGVRENLLNYAIASGFGYEFKPKKKLEVPEDLCDSVCEWLEEFEEENDWDEWEEELYDRGVVEGEWFLRLFHVGQGCVHVRAVETDQVTESGHPQVAVQGHTDVSWSYGVLTPADDSQNVIGYNIRYWDKGQTEYIDADEIVHAKFNVHKNVKRGLSDFYPVDSDFPGAKKLMKNMRDGASLQAAIAWIEQFPEGTRKSTVEAINSGKVDFVEIAKMIGSAGTTKTTNVRKYQSGTILQIADGKEYQPPPMGAERAPHFVLILQAALRAIGIRWSMPEYMMSGDASNANYSSTLVSESPFVRKITRSQGKTKKHYTKVIWRALEIAIASSTRFGDYTFEQIKAWFELIVTPVPPETRDKTAETQRNQTLNMAGIISKKTWANREDVDFDEQQAQIKTEQPATNDAALKAVQDAMNAPPPDAKATMDAALGTTNG